jgi:hypothetical protein
MSKDSLTIVLNGEVTLGDFSIAVNELFRLVTGLGTDVARDTSIEWMIDSLEAGSAIATIKGFVEEGKDRGAIEKVVDAYLDIGRSIQKGEQIGYSKQVQTAANRITSLVNGRIKSIRFETIDADVELFSRPQIFYEMEKAGFLKANFGAVRGRVQSMTSRRGLRFTLYDLINDRGISCYLAQGSEDIMREAWGRIALVEGLVKRDPETGQPTTVRNVRDIHIISEGKLGDYREAIGAAKGFLGDELPEDVIRRGRDV